MLLSLNEVRLQLNLLDGEESDEFLTALALAAESYTVEYCNRNFYATVDDIPEDDTTGIVLPDCVKHAMVMLLAHFYEHRESSTALTVKVLPFGFEQLAGIKRIRQLGDLDASS